MRKRSTTDTPELDTNAAECPFSGGGMSRRGVLAGGALIAASPLLVGGETALAKTSGKTGGTAAPSAGGGVVAPRGTHGSKLTQAHIAQIGAPGGKFGRMFPNAGSFAPSDALLDGLAEAMTESGGSGSSPDNPTMPSGFIYLGQFIDHDITRDGNGSDPAVANTGLVDNFDTPKFDLAAVYGETTDNMRAQLYATDGRHLLLRPNRLGIMDLPRDDTDHAFTGDPRNDENLIINQMQQAFIKMHNAFVDAGLSFDPVTRSGAARTKAQFLFQWVIVHDFLPHVVGQSMVDSLVAKTSTGKLTTRNKFYLPAAGTIPYMPVEFAVAAYRWGHSGIRPDYRMHSGGGSHLPIFDLETGPIAQDLRGSQPLYDKALIDWNKFFEIPGLAAPGDRNFARAIDTQVARPLHDLPSSVVGSDLIRALGARNLRRCKLAGLASGQAVAKAMNLPYYTNRQLDPTGKFGLSNSGWKGEAPLWFYCLREAEIAGNSQRLGPVAGRIVAEVILGLIAADDKSYWNADPTFDPGSGFKMGDLLKLAGPIDTSVDGGGD